MASGRTANTTVWPMPFRRSSQLSAAARGRHLVGKGSRTAARSTCEARRRAVLSESVEEEDAEQPSEFLHRSNGMAATAMRAAERNAIAAAVPSRPRQRSALVNEAKPAQALEELVDDLGFGQAFQPLGDGGHLRPDTQLSAVLVTYSAASATPSAKRDGSSGRTKRAISICRAIRARWANRPARSNCRAVANSREVW